MVNRLKDLPKSDRAVGFSVTMSQQDILGLASEEARQYPTTLTPFYESYSNSFQIAWSQSLPPSLSTRR